MPSTGQERVKAIFATAMETPGPERQAFLDQACGGDAALRIEVDALLSASERAGDFLISPTVENAPTTRDMPGSLLQEGPGTKIGPYKLLQLIGEGGFGSVFMAEQERPVRRKVALKIIKLGMDTRQVIARFEAERQALAMMDHPNIARVLDAGATETGRPYFVMELVKGDPITGYCDDNHLSIEERLELFTQVCNAVQHAHQRGIIHRDIKPGNVLVSTQDGRAFAKVIDFGIAKALADRLTEKTLFTEYHQFLGTPAYMSPEQAAGTLDIDTRTDVYSLGALLYELLTGSAPFEIRELRSAAYEEMRRIIREVEPPKPSTRLSQSTQTLPGVAASRRIEPKHLGGLVRGELDWIVMKALEKDRSRRYESANALAADLLRHRAGEAVIAAPPTALYRLRKFVRRHKAALTTVAMIFVVLIAGILASTWEAASARRARDVAQIAKIQADGARAQAEKAQVSEAEQRAKAEEQTRMAKRQLADGLASQGDALRLVGRVLEARDSLLRSRSLYQELGIPVLGADLGLFNLELDRAAALMTYRGHTAGVLSVAFSPDGRTALSGSRDKTLKLWDLGTGKALRTFSGHTAQVSSVAFSRDGRTALSGSGDRTLKLWDIATGNELRTFSGHTDSVFGVAFSPDGRTALSCSGDQTLKLWDVATGKELRTFSGHTAGVYGVAFSPDGRTALSASYDNTVKLWDIATGKELRTFLNHNDGVSSVAFSPDGRTALSGSYDDLMKLWDIATGKEIRSYTRFTGWVLSVAFSPDGLTALSGGEDQTMKLWFITSGDVVLHTFSGHTAQVSSVAFSPDGQTALSGSDDGTMKMWRVPVVSNEPIHFFGHSGYVIGVAYSPDGRTALSGSYDWTMKLWDVATGKELRTFLGHTAQVASVAFSPDGRTALSGSADKTLKLWDIATRKELRTFSGHTSSVNGVAFSPDGRTALSGSDDHTLKLWDIFTGKELRTFSGHTDCVRGVAFAPDGRSALSGSDDKTLKLWDIATGKELRTFSGHTSPVYSVAFSVDGRTVLSGSEDRTLKLWDVATGKVLRTFSGHINGVCSIAFSPDGRSALSGSRDQTVRLWDIATGKELHAFSAQTWVWGVAFSPDGRAALSTYSQNTLKLWDFGRVETSLDLERKVDAAQQALQSHDQDPSALAVLGQWYAVRSADNWAVELLERARAGGASISPLMLGRCYWNLNRFADARREFGSAFSASQDSSERSYLALCIQGIEAATAITDFDFAYLREQQGKYAEAEANYRQALALMTKTLGPDDRMTVMALNDLGTVVAKVGRLTDAEAIDRQALDAARNEHAGPGKDDVLGASLANLAEVLKQQGKLAEAEPVFREYDTLRPDSAASQYPKMAWVLSDFGEVLQGEGKAAKAEATYRRALALIKKTRGPEDRGVVVMLNYLGDLLAKQGRAMEAEPLFRQATAISGKLTPGPDRIELLDWSIWGIGKVADLLDNSGKIAEAASLRKEFGLRKPPIQPATIRPSNDPTILSNSHG